MDCVSDELWYGVSEKGFARFLQGWARAFADPVEVGVHRHAEGAVCVFGFVLGSAVYREYREPSTFHPVISSMMVKRRA